MQSGSDYLSASKAMQSKMENDYSLDNPVMQPGNVYARNSQPSPPPAQFGGMAMASNVNGNRGRLPPGMVVGGVGRK